MPMRLLVTGVHGFVGSTLSRMVTTENSLRDWQVADVPVDLDLRDRDCVDDLVAAAAPDAVVHLAAQSFVPESVRDPEATFNVNVLGTLHLLQALKRNAFGGRMLFVGTGDVYGSVPEDELPVDELRLPAPRNPYAVSKLAAEALCFQWTVSERMPVVMARPFNHIGPRQSERFAVADFARQIAEIKRGARPPIVAVGDIDVTRDFTDVRDVVMAYFALLAEGTPGQVYNVCSGREHSLRSLLTLLAERAGVDVRIDQDPARLRQSEQRRMRGDPSKIRSTTKWEARIPVADSVSAMLDCWTTKEDHG
jgi:GDP-4-dehydro-6-deoxy-D-mannose reductase